MTELDIWHAQVSEDIIEPERPIIDPHHHLWRMGTPYELDDLWADTKAGHNITGTVFIECGAEYRADGPAALRPVGETEYVVAQAKQARKGKAPGKPPILDPWDCSCGCA
jgi:L-fuconolactonase